MKGSEVEHHSVLLTEAVNHLVTKPGGIYIDATFGRGGHSRAILQKLSANGLLIALDRDPEAIAAANVPEFKDDSRFTIIKSTFSQVASVVEQEQLTGKITGILMDFGVSSPQLDDAQRGFSFMREGPLDMRMDPTQGVSAATWLSDVDEKSLADVLKVYGEERHASRIARAILGARAVSPITTTKQLAEIVAAASPSFEKNKHPATRAFQAIRIYINAELDEIKACLEQALEVLAPDGRMVAISFHSLEDRIVKQFFQKQSKGDELPRGLPLRESEIKRNIRLKRIGKALKASEQEVQFNPRARSAVLRIAEKLL